MSSPRRNPGRAAPGLPGRPRATGVAAGAQRAVESLGVLKPGRTILGERGRHDGVERRRDRKLGDLGRWPRILVADLERDRLDGAREGLLARQQFVENHARAEKVGAAIDLLALALLGRHV